MLFQDFQTNKPGFIAENDKPSFWAKKSEVQIPTQAQFAPMSLKKIGSVPE